METNDTVRKDVCEQKHYTIDDRFKNVHHRIDELRDLVTVVKQQGEAISEMNTALQVLITEFRETKRDVSKFKDDLEDVKEEIRIFQNKPAKEYEKIKLIAITSIITGLISVVLTKIFGS